MLGCIQPMSSPMMKRMLGFCPCWAEAGMLAIVVAVHITTRAPQIVLNMLMVAFLDVGCRKAGAAAFAQLHPPTDNASADPCGITLGLSVGRLAEVKLIEATRTRY